MSKLTITKLQAILIIDLIIVASAAGAYIYFAPALSPLDTAQIQLSNLTIDQTEVEIGQSVNIAVNVTNPTQGSGPYQVDLSIDGALTQNKTIEFSGPQSVIVDFNVLAPEGVHTAKIGNLTQTFMVVTKFQLTDLAINRTLANVNEPVGISVIVTNVRNSSGTYNASLYINDVLEETKSVHLDGGEATSVEFAVLRADEGTYSVKIGSLTSSFTISKNAPPPKLPKFELSDFAINPDVIQVGDSVTISIKVSNVGEAVGDYTVTLTINGSPVETKSVQLAGGNSSIVTFTVTEKNEGTYNVKIGDFSGTFKAQTIPISTSIVLSGMTVNPYEVWVNEPVTITVQATNTAAEAGILPIKLMINNIMRETKTVQLEGGASQAVQFVVTETAEVTKAVVFSVKVGTMSGAYQVVPTGMHTLIVDSFPKNDIPFKLNGEPLRTAYSALLPEGSYTIAFQPKSDNGQETFISWENGNTNPTRTISLTSRMTVSASYTGGSSCPSLYLWNGTANVYVSEVSNHGWLGYINYINEDGSIVFYRNHPWDYIPLDKTQMQLTGNSYNLTLLQRWDEIFYLDQAYMVAVDHPADVDVYSTMVEQYLDPAYMGNIYTISKKPLTPVSAVNQKGENVLSEISSIDDVFTPGINGLNSPAWNNISWNTLTLDLGNLSDAEQIKLVVRAIVDWGSPKDYDAWIGGFYEAIEQGILPNGTQITPPPYMEVKAENGSWIRVQESRQFPLPPDGKARTFVVDLTGLFPANDYSLRINNFWNVTFDYIGVDVTSNEAVTIQKINPTAYLYQKYWSPSVSAGNFTRYGDVTELVLTEDDMFVIGRQGDAVSLQFNASSLAPPAEGMMRDYFFYVASWFKDENGNWGFGFGFTVDPLPFLGMSGFPYPDTEQYPSDPAHLNYLQEWNTRVVSLSG